MITLDEEYINSLELEEIDFFLITGIFNEPNIVHIDSMFAMLRASKIDLNYEVFYERLYYYFTKQILRSDAAYIIKDKYLEPVSELIKNFKNL